MSNKSNATIATMGIDIGKNSFHVVGLDRRGAIVLRQKWSRGEIEATSPCLIGVEACVGAQHLSPKLQAHAVDPAAPAGLRQRRAASSRHSQRLVSFDRASEQRHQAVATTGEILAHALPFMTQ